MRTRLRAIALGLVVAAVATAGVSTLASARASGDQAAALQQRLAELRDEADRLARESRTLLTELRQLEVDRQLREAELTERASALEAAEAALEALEAEQDTLAASIARDRPLVRARVVELYKHGPQSNLRRLVDAAAAGNTLRAWRQMEAAAARDAARFDAYRASLTRLDAARNELLARHEDARRLRLEAAAARSALDRAIARHEQRLNAIDRERDLTAELIGELRAAEVGLAATVEGLPSGASGATPPAGNVPISGFRTALPWPVRGRVVRPFRGTGTGDALPFNGVEIAVTDGAPVAAVYPGDVAFSGPFTGFGHLIIVQHDAASFTLYGHLTSG